MRCGAAACMLAVQLLAVVSSLPAHPRDLHPRDLHPRDLHPRDLHPRDLHPRDLHPRDLQPRDLQPRDLQPRDLQPAHEVLQLEPVEPTIYNDRQPIINTTDLQIDSGEVISVRITSSVAVDRGRNLNILNTINNNRTKLFNIPKIKNLTEGPKSKEVISPEKIFPDLSGANLEFIKQLNSKKELKESQYVENIHPYQKDLRIYERNITILDTDDTFREESEKSDIENPRPDTKYKKNSANVPLARSISFVSKDLINYDKTTTNNQPLIYFNDINKKSNFNIVHEKPNITIKETLNQTPTIFNEPSKVYGEPAKVYGVPAKIYSEPAKVYSEPAKIYSVPAKVYSEPAKIYGEPAKFYSEPASLHLELNMNHSDKQNEKLSSIFNTTVNETLHHAIIEDIIDEDNISESNYEVDEEDSVLTDGKSQGIQDSTTENSKVGYVVEGKQYRKYRVEERTSDGFIVGEYGVVRNKDGALRGVRYTADGEASPRLIYDALMKFLKLK